MEVDSVGAPLIGKGVGIVGKTITRLPTSG
jgi:hypothetical protein